MRSAMCHLSISERFSPPTNLTCRWTFGFPKKAKDWVKGKGRQLCLQEISSGAGLRKSRSSMSHDFIMNIFGKNKNPPQAPPSLPSRPENFEQVAHVDTEEEEEEKEEEDDDQYTYEVPPNEVLNKRLTPAKQQEAAENIYLDRPALRRFSEPNNFLQPKPHLQLSKHGAEGSNEEEMTRFLAIEKALKAGKMKPPPPPPLPLSARRVSLPVLSSSGQQLKTSTNRDTFPALKDDEEESVYLVCEPNKDPLPCRLPLCPISTRPLKQPRAAISQSGPQPGLAENSPQGEGLKSGSLPEDSSMQNKAWYAGTCDRRTAEAALLRFNKDSAYLVRRSSGHGWNQPYTLVVLYKKRVYNIPIRYLESSHQYTLGKDGKSHEELFDNIASIIQSYMERPLVLIDGTTSSKEQTCLVFPVKP